MLSISKYFAKNPHIDDDVVPTLENSVGSLQQTLSSVGSKTFPKLFLLHKIFWNLDTCDVISLWMR